ncbi:MAG: hypothetical protein J6M12_02100 [Clostridia bacterium]|nr:hypothetical protein [Clostridia bacterium]
MKKEHQKLTLKEKQQIKKKKEKQFTVIALCIIAVILVVSAIIMIVAIAREVGQDQTPFTKEELIGSWYDENGTDCWRFSDQGYVYFYTRSKDTEPYLSKFYADYTFFEEESKLNIFYKANTPTAFTCSVKDGKMTLTEGENVQVLVKGIPISDRNKEILGIPLTSESEG